MPAQLQVARGNPGKRRMTEYRMPPVGEIAPPSGMSAKALGVWAEVMPPLARLGVLRQTDAAMLGRYCELAAKHWRVERELREGNLTVKVSSSTMNERERVSPLFQMQADIERRMTAIEDRFGMSPTARQTLLARLPPPAGMGEDAVTAGSDGDPVGFLN